MIQVRHASEDDVAQLAAFRVAFVAEARGLAASELSSSFVRSTFESHRRSFADGRLRAWIATRHDDVVGVVTVLVDEVPPRPEDNRVLQGFVTNLHVQVGHRSRGVGRMLMQACLDDAANSGIRSIGLHTTHQGRRLYEDLGFREQTSWLELAVDRSPPDP